MQVRFSGSFTLAGMPIGSLGIPGQTERKTCEGMDYRCYESGNMRWLRMEPYWIRKNISKRNGGWQINLARDLTAIYPNIKVKELFSLSEEQLEYALSLIQKAKKGELTVIREG